MKPLQFKGVFNMLEAIVFAITLVISQLVAGFIIMELFMSEKFISYWMKIYIKLIESISNELMEGDKEEA